MSSENDQNNDEAFLTLVSSQRAFLNRLTCESTLRQTPQQTNTAPRSFDTRAAEPRSLMNRPIFDQNAGLEMLMSRRLSMGMGSFGTESFGMNFRPGNSFEEQKMKEISTSSEPMKMRQRRSSMDQLSALLLGESSQPQLRRMSLISNLSGPDDLDQLLSLENSPPKAENVHLDPSIPQEEVQGNLRKFADAMGNSTKSQQDIHDWDRKMGLKRSHSKTMRMTMRSRKKLRTMLKKDINALPPNSTR
eukprot:Nitzschia sp. Nitz4//scaffold150_size53981//7818//8579//NITZ4_006670-RA/size53981-processed-gene-0.24-mRNA-1//-1//CDS//3329537050//3492//frame0